MWKRQRQLAHEFALRYISYVKKYRLCTKRRNSYARLAMPSRCCCLLVAWRRKKFQRGMTAVHFIINAHRPTTNWIIDMFGIHLSVAEPRFRPHAKCHTRFQMHRVDENKFKCTHAFSFLEWVMISRYDSPARINRCGAGARPEFQCALTLYHQAERSFCQCGVCRSDGKT